MIACHLFVQALLQKISGLRRVFLLLLPVWLLGGCVSPPAVVEFSSVQIRVILIASLASKGSNRLSKDLLELTLPYRIPEQPGKAFKPVVVTTRIDLASQQDFDLSRVLEFANSAQSLQSTLQRFWGAKPGFEAESLRVSENLDKIEIPVHLVNPPRSMSEIEKGRMLNQYLSDSGNDQIYFFNHDEPVTEVWVNGFNFPCFNNMATLKDSIARYFAEHADKELSDEVLVVLDLLPDGTSDLPDNLDKLQHRIDSLRVEMLFDFPNPIDGMNHFRHLRNKYAELFLLDSMITISPNQSDNKLKIENIKKTTNELNELINNCIELFYNDSLTFSLISKVESNGYEDIGIVKYASRHCRTLQTSLQEGVYDAATSRMLSPSYPEQHLRRLQNLVSKIQTDFNSTDSIKVILKQCETILNSGELNSVESLWRSHRELYDECHSALANGIRNAGSIAPVLRRKWSVLQNERKTVINESPPSPIIRPEEIIDTLLVKIKPSAKEQIELYQDFALSYAALSAVGKSERYGFALKRNAELKELENGEEGPIYKRTQRFYAFRAFWEWIAIDSRGIATDRSEEVSIRQIWAKLNPDDKGFLLIILGKEEYNRLSSFITAGGN